MVNRFSLLINSNIRKSRSKLIVIALLFVLSSLLLNLVFIVNIDYKENFNRYKESLNASDTEYVYTDIFNLYNEEDINDVIKSIDGVSYAQTYETLSFNGETEFGDGNIINIITVVPYSRVKDLEYNRFEILEEDPSIVDGVYISHLYKVSCGYKLGDSFTISYSGNEYDFIIKGFYNNVSTGTINCIDISILVSDSKYNELKGNNPSSYKIGISFDEDVKKENRSSIVSSAISSNFKLLVLMESSSIENLSVSRYTNATVFEAVLLVSSIIIICILLVIIAIVLSNYVKSNIVNFGTFKAMGYTSSSLITPLILEFSIFSVIFSLIGVFSSYLVFPIINQALEGQIGIPYRIHILFLPLLFTILISLFLTIITSYLSISKIKTIEPINAIKESKNKPRKLNNILSLDKTKVELNTAIGLKSCLSNVVRNIIIFVCYFSISFLLGFSCFLYKSIIQKADKVIELICGQFPSSALNVEKNHVNEIKEIINNDDRVDYYYLYSVKATIPKDLPELMLYIIDDPSCIKEDVVLLEGSLPSKQNEILMNKAYALKNNLSINDTVTFLKDEEEFNFIICGLSQGAYYSGDDCFILLSGYNTFDSLDTFQFYINLKDGINIDDFNKTYKDKNIISILNQTKYYNSLSESYKSILIILTIVIIILSIIISSFVLYILISLLLENNRREHGILKSLGFVTKDLIYQVALSLLPFSIISSLFGIIISREYSSTLISLLLNNLGVFRFGEKISLLSASSVFASIVIFSIIFTVLQSLKISKITPHELFNKE